jgi:hypothetical protein
VKVQYHQCPKAPAESGSSYLEKLILIYVNAWTCCCKASNMDNITVHSKKIFCSNFFIKGLIKKGIKENLKVLGEIKTATNFPKKKN